jgi:putative oxidoreductase
VGTAPIGIPTGWYALPLRLIVGYGFLEHGLAKLGRGPEHFISILAAIGVPHPTFLGGATIAVEIIGGLMVLFGALLPLISIPMVAVLAVAALTVHWPYGFSSIKLMSYDLSGAHFGQPGYETDLLYLACLLALCIGGAGPLSVDSWLSRFRRSGPR